MSKGHVVIHAEFCKGCAYCQQFCPRDCITLSENVLNPLGYHPAVFSNGERCNACGVCAWMCPSLCIEVYKKKSAVGAGADR